MARAAVAVFAVLCLSAGLAAALPAEFGGPGTVTDVERFCPTYNTSFPPVPGCPPKGFDSVRNFDIESYISAPWFVQLQTPLLYQPKSELFCVRARYVPFNASNLQEGLHVYNYANKGKVNGPMSGANASSPFREQLIARPLKGELLSATAEETMRSKLRVGMAALEPVLGQGAFGNYWVAYYDGQHALVTGGPPCYPGLLEGTCSPSLPKENLPPGLPPNTKFLAGGLWMLTRKQVDPEGADFLTLKAVEMGFDTWELAQVQQEGCRYEGAEP